jgi:outer membrane lipoprotein-sorting protein
MKRLLAVGVLTGLLLTACGASGDTPPAPNQTQDCDALFKVLDDFRTAHQQKVISGAQETDAELTQYQNERDRLVANYEAQCGPLS